jgi:transcriptional repressor NF-X1
VQIFRRIDTRIPIPLLSQVLLSSPPPVSLGKLADLRSPTAQQQRRSPVPVANVVKIATPSPPAGSTTQRGWTAVVARSGASTPTTPVVGSLATPNPSAMSSSGNGSRSRTQPANLAIPLSVATTELDVKVPDNWEDDEEISR